MSGFLFDGGRLPELELANASIIIRLYACVIENHPIAKKE